MTNCGFGNWTAPHPLLKQEKNMKKIKLATTSFRDKTLFKPTASASTGSGGPCNEHRQKAKSCVLNYEILMFHCFTVTICRSNTSSALCFSDTQWQQLRQWSGSKMSLNHVEPCWTLPLRNTTFDCLERPCPNTAPASAITSESGNTCRKPSSKDSKVWHSEIQCFNIFQWFSMYVSLAPGGMLRFRVPLCSAGTTGWWWAWVMSKIPWGKVQTWALEGW